jgi:hypothetical protein
MKPGLGFNRILVGVSQYILFQFPAGWREGIASKQRGEVLGGAAFCGGKQLRHAHEYNQVMMSKASIRAVDGIVRILSVSMGAGVRSRSGKRDLIFVLKLLINKYLNDITWTKFRCEWRWRERRRRNVINHLILNNKQKD